MSKSAVTFFIVVAIVVIRVVFFSPSIEEELAKTCEIINKDCPQTIDEETRLDKVTSGPGKSFTYHYTLINFVKADLINIAQIQSAQDAAVRNELQNNPAIKKDILGRGITMVYRYYDKNNDFLFEVVINP